MIIGLAGEKQSGKDTVAAYLIKQYGFERRAFADPLKKSVAALFNIPFHEVDKLKSDPNVEVSLYTFDHGKEEIGTGHSLMSFREFLQRYGTESHRDVFSRDFWLDYTLPKNGYYAGRSIVISDCRFNNEAMRIRELGGKIVRIKRPGIESADTHESEQFPFIADYTIHNDNTLDDLWAKVEAMLLWVGNDDD